MSFADSRGTNFDFADMLSRKLQRTTKSYSGKAHHARIWKHCTRKKDESKQLTMPLCVSQNTTVAADLARDE